VHARDARKATPGAICSGVRLPARPGASTCESLRWEQPRRRGCRAVARRRRARSAARTGRLSRHRTARGRPRWSPARGRAWTSSRRCGRTPDSASSGTLPARARTQPRDSPRSSGARMLRPPRRREPGARAGALRRHAALLRRRPQRRDPARTRRAPNRCREQGVQLLELRTSERRRDQARGPRRSRVQPGRRSESRAEATARYARASPARSCRKCFPPRGTTAPNTNVSEGRRTCLCRLRAGCVPVTRRPSARVRTRCSPSFGTP
jgi:hypothetical protein